MNKVSEGAQSLLAIFVGVVFIAVVICSLFIFRDAYITQLNQKMFNEAYAASLECRQAVSAAHASPSSPSVDYDEVCGQVPVYVGG